MSQYHPFQKLFNFTLAFELKRAWDKHICAHICGLWQEPAQRLGAKDRHSLLAVGKAQSRMKMLTKLQEEAVAVGWEFHR